MTSYLSIDVSPDHLVHQRRAALSQRLPALHDPILLRFIHA